jgi:hypothetical protein
VDVSSLVEVVMFTSSLRLGMSELDRSQGEEADRWVAVSLPYLFPWLRPRIRTKLNRMLTEVDSKGNGWYRG